MSHGILASVSDLSEIRDAARAFIAARDWEKLQDPKSVLLALVGEVGEVAELLQWLPAESARELIREEPLHTRVAEELADVLVYLVGLADQCGVDLKQAALGKIAASVRSIRCSRTGESPQRRPIVADRWDPLVGHISDLKSYSTSKMTA